MFTTSAMDKAYNHPTARARELRSNATNAERLLWTHLGARKVAGIRFNRQVPIGPFICDFVSRSLRLVIEVDGGQHSAETDARRTRFLKDSGLRVIRFWNNDVLANTDGVIAEIERVIRDMPSPDPSRLREGSLPRERS